MVKKLFYLSLIVILAALSLWIIKPYINYILFAVILSYITYPVYVKIKSKLRNKTISALIVIFFIALIVIIPLMFIISQLIFQAKDIFIGLGTFELGKLKILEEKISDYTGVNLNIIDRLAGLTTNLGSNAISYMLTNILDITKKVANLFVGLGIMFFSMFYFYVDGDRIAGKAKELIPIDEKYKTHLFKRIHDVSQALFLGIFLTALAQGIVGGLGFFIFGVPNAIFWGFLMTIFAMIPFLGAPLVWIPGVIYLIYKGSLLSGIGLFIYGLILISNIDNWIRPKIVRVSVKIHPLTIIYGVIGGVLIFGIPGLVIGPLILVIFLELLEVYMMKKRGKSRKR